MHVQSYKITRKLCAACVHTFWRRYRISLPEEVVQFTCVAATAFNIPVVFYDLASEKSN